jgi:AcrR family transcriptional regulator
MDSTERILDAALALLKRRKRINVSMADIARAAGLSRQALYLHFPGRTDLMLALARYAHEKLGVAAQLRQIDEAPTGLDALGVWISLQAKFNASVWSVARLLDAARRTDPAAERGWQDRQQHRLERCRQIVTRMETEGALKSGLSLQAAADLLWSVTSLRAWEELTQERGWSAGEYEARIGRLLHDALVAKNVPSPYRGGGIPIP